MPAMTSGTGAAALAAGVAFGGGLLSLRAISPTRPGSVDAPGAGAISADKAGLPEPSLGAALSELPLEWVLADLAFLAFGVACVWMCGVGQSGSYRTGRMSRSLDREVIGGIGGGSWNPKKDIQAEVFAFSGCKDWQTSADVGSSPSGTAGGACTAAILGVLEAGGQMTWLELLAQMRRHLRNQVPPFDQIPQLSYGGPVDLHEPFSIAGERTKALLVGINYGGLGRGRELTGCHNDVKKIKAFLKENGYSNSSIKVLLDGGMSKKPTLQHIRDGMDWLVAGAREGDTLFFHYSGHGVQVDDVNHDERDAKDEAIVPSDFQQVGVMVDDEISERLVKPLPFGVRLVCVTDCCHSGTIIDLPYQAEAIDIIALVQQLGEHTLTLEDI